MSDISFTEPSEGELFIMDFLKEVKIKFELEVKIEGLENDTKQYRVADFYLPEYKVYIEFYGLWNKGNVVQDEEYKIKKSVFRKNRIPCIYLYPENLGFLYHALDHRLIQCMKYYEMKDELRKYRSFKFRNMALANILFASFLAFLIVYGLISPEEDVYLDTYSIMLILFAYQCYRMYDYYKKIFIQDRFTLIHFID